MRRRLSVIVVLAALIIAAFVWWLRDTPVDDIATPVTTRTRAARSQATATGGDALPTTGIGPRADDTGEDDELPLDAPMTAADGSLDVTVRNDERTLPDADVRLYWRGHTDPATTKIDWRFVGSARSNRDGVASIAAKPGRYFLAVRLSPYAVYQSDVKRHGGEERTAVTITMRRAETLRVRVMQKGRDDGIAFATLAIAATSAWSGSPNSERTIVRTDSEGRAQISTLALGGYQAQVSAESFAPTDATLNVPSSKEVRIDLNATASIEGVVVDAHDMPVGGATVTAFGHTDPLHAVTGAAGTFAIDAPAGTYTLQAVQGATSSPLSQPVNVTAARTSSGLRLTLGGTGTFEGTVTSAASGEPLAGVTVIVSPYGFNGANGRTVTATDGSFRVEGIAPGSYDVDFEREGYARALQRGLNLKAGDTFKVMQALQGQGRVGGQVTTLEGTPIAGALVGFTRDTASASARTDAQGHYELTMDAGDGYLVARYEDVAWGTRLQVKVREGAFTTQDFKLAPAAVVTGHVVDEVGRAVAGADVQIYGRRNGGGGSVGSDDMGAFEMRLPPGSYAMRASLAEMASVEPAPLDLKAGDKAVVTLKLAPPAEKNLTGMVLDAAGRPVSNASVDAGNTYARTDETGHFTMHVDTTQAVKLLAMYRMQRGELELAAGGNTREVVVKLKPAATLHGSVRDAAGQPAAAFTLSIVAKTRGLYWQSQRYQGGTFDIFDAPVGAYELRARSPDGRSGSVAVQSESGADTRVDVTLSATPTP